MTARAGTGPEAFPIQTAENEGLPTRSPEAARPGHTTRHLSKDKTAWPGQDVGPPEETT